MTALLRAELIKLRTVRAPLWLLVAAVGLVVLLVTITVPTHDVPGDAISLHDTALLARSIAAGAGGGEVILLVLGILAMTNEYRSGTATATFLITPARARVLTAKTLALAIAGLLFAAVILAVGVPQSVLLIHLHNGTISWSAQTWQVIGGVGLTMVLYGALGVGLGALIRNQVAAVVIGLLWLLVLDQILIGLVPAVGRWTMGGATAGLLQLGSSATTRGDLLPAWAGGCLLVAYTSLIWLLARALTTRRDVP
jgi:ABC-type transport system involved in multi-copper enzyme maturation permease subunit